MNFNATIIGQSLSFILFIFFCMKYIWPSIISVIENRKKEIEDTLLFVKKAKEELKIYRRNTEYDIKIIKKNASDIINSAIKQKSKILEKAHLEAESEKRVILKQAKIDIDIEYQKIRDELRCKVSSIAIEIAEKVLKRSIHVIKDDDTISSLIRKI